jgi:PAS domain S-box-containing protein
MTLEDLLVPESKILLDFIYDGVYVVDRGRRILFWNRGAEAITGHRAKDVMGRCCRNGILNHIDENGRRLCGAFCPLTRTMATGERVEEKIYPLHKAGHRFATKTHVAPVRDGAGRIIGAIEVFRDISAEERFRALKEKFDKLIQRYVSKTTYASVVKASSKDGGPKAATKDLTVLFLDVVSFTAFSEKYPASRVVEMLNMLFSLCARAIAEHSGDIDKYIGDCVMAVFVEAQDAADAARAIQAETMPKLNKALKFLGLPGIKVRIGISSGRLIQGDIGSSERKDMTVIGDVVNTASRVENAAEPGSFLISESTYSRLSRPEEFVFHQAVSLKGKGRPVRVYKPKNSRRAAP